MNKPDMSSVMSLSLPFKILRIKYRGLSYSLFQAVVSSRYVFLCLVVIWLVFDVSGNRRGPYFGFFCVLCANETTALTLLSSREGRPDCCSS